MLHTVICKQTISLLKKKFRPIDYRLEVFLTFVGVLEIPKREYRTL